MEVRLFQTQINDDNAQHLAAGNIMDAKRGKSIRI